MSPEYRVYIPPGSAESYESLMNHMPEWPIISQRAVKKDFPPITRQDLKFKEIVQTVRSTLDQIPEDTLVEDLTFWDEPAANKERKHIQNLPQWIELMRSLKPHERVIITRSINTLVRARKKLGQNNATLEDARNLDWSNIPHFDGLGNKSKDFLTQVFSSQIQP